MDVTVEVVVGKIWGSMAQPWNCGKYKDKFCNDDFIFELFLANDQMTKPYIIFIVALREKYLVHFIAVLQISSM